MEANHKMVISDYQAAFCTAFGRADVTMSHLNQLRKRKRWKVGRDGARYRGRRRLYNPEEIAWLQANVTLPTVEYHRQFCELFDRDDRSVEDLVNLRHREHWLTGRDARFKKGQPAANKGKKMPYNANSARTQFKKGQRPHTWRGPGYERIDKKDGYIIMIVAERNPWTGADTRPVLKHKWLWEQANGPVPPGHVLKSLDGNKLNTDPSNWEAVPRGLVPFLQPHRGIDYATAHPDVKPAVMALAKLRYARKTVADRGEK